MKKNNKITALINISVLVFLVGYWGGGRGRGRPSPVPDGKEKV